MLRKKLFDAKMQVALWVLAVFSICLNIYFISNNIPYPLFKHNADEEFIVSEAEPSTEQSQAQLQGPTPAQKLVTILKPDANGIIKFDLGKEDTFASVLKLANVDNEVINSISRAVNKALPVSHVKRGSRIEIEVDQTATNDQFMTPKRVTVFHDTSRIDTTFDVAANSFIAKRSALPLTWQLKLVSGTINGSLYSSAKRNGADPGVVNQLIGLFNHTVDFQRDIHAGDKFKIMYEYQTDFSGKLVKNPKILFAALNLGNDTKELFRHELASGSIEYFDGKGNSIKKTLLRTPIHSAKISSHYGMREHPIHGYSKMHQGLDYSAPRGTPVLAAGNGVVKYIKHQARGYGKHIEIKHNDKYSTLYAHLSNVSSNLRPGSKVSQGQVIGHVGSTGTATGPHLHYEVIQNGKKVNPSKVADAKVVIPLKGTELAKFKDNVHKVGQMVAELDDSRTSKVAQN